MIHNTLYILILTLCVITCLYLVEPSEAANGPLDSCKHVMSNCSETSSLFDLSVTANYQNLSVSWNNEALQNNKGLQHFDIYYVQTREKSNSSAFKCRQVTTDINKLNIDNLASGMNYTVHIIAEYDGNTCKQSANYTTNTKGHGGDVKPCNCFKPGTIGTGDSCHYNTGQCQCKHEYVGKTCHKCTLTYYLDEKSGKCKHCNCSKFHYSSASCKANGDEVLCDCKPSYAGPKCDQCEYGYYLTDMHVCEKCQCNGNANPNSSACDRSAKCINCMRNTTGDHCEKCKEHYVGDPTGSRNCTLYSDLNPDESNIEKHLIIVIVVCIFLAVALITFAVIYIYRNCTRHRYKPFGFWTVQLRDDHEAVNFRDQMEYHDSENHESLKNDRKLHI